MQNNNLEIYENLWSKISVLPPSIWSFFKISSQYKGKAILDIGCGKYPRVPVEGTYFLDISKKAIDALNQKGGKGVVGEIENMPFADKQFDLVVAFEILEHIEHDQKALQEICRVLKDNGLVFIATPLHQKWFTLADTEAGHVRRYEPAELLQKARNAGFALKNFSVSGITPFVYGTGFIRWIYYGLMRTASRSDNTKMLSCGINVFIYFIAFFEKMRGTTWHAEDQYIKKTKNRAGVTLALKKKVATMNS